MTERPILFRAEMVRAILAGRKTQTRRAIKPQPWVDNMGNACWKDRNFGQSANHVPHIKALASPIPCSDTKRVLCPYGQPGDLLWVRETWCLTRDTLDYETGGEASSYDWDKDLYGDPRSYLNGGPGVGDCAALHYPTDGEDNTPSEMWPCIGLRGEILRKKEIRWRPSIHMPRWASRITLRITDVRVERLQDIREDDARAEGCNPIIHEDGAIDCGTRKTTFARLWNQINGPGAWEANPWVWVLSFERVKP